MTTATAVRTRATGVPSDAVDLPAPRRTGAPARDVVPDWLPASLLTVFVVFPVLAERLHGSLTPVVLTAVLMGLNDVVALARRDRNAVLPLVAVATAVLLSLVLVRIFVVTQGAQWADSFQKLLVIAPLVACAGFLATRSGRITVYLRALLVAVSVSAPVAWLEWATNSLLVQPGRFARNDHVRAVVGAEHPLTLATLLVAMVPVAVRLLPGWRGRVLAVVLYSSVWATDSNGPQVVGLLVLALSLWPSMARRIATPATTLLFFASVGTYLALGSRVWSDQIPGTTTAEVSNGYRAALYHLLPQLLAEHPLGFGLNGLPIDTYYFYTLLGVVDVSNTVDSELVLLATRAGILGVCLFAGMCAASALAVQRLRPVATSMWAVNTIGLFLALHAWTSMIVLWFLLLGSCLAVVGRAGSAAGPFASPDVDRGQAGRSADREQPRGSDEGSGYVGVRAGTRAFRPRLADEFRRGWRRAAFMVLLAAVGAGAGAVAGSRSPDSYSASAQIFVSASSVDSSSGLNQSGQFTQARVQSYVNVVNSPLVLDKVRTQLGLQEPEAELAAQVSADAPLDKTLINVVVTDDRPDQVAAIANAVAEQFIQELPNIETQQVVASQGQGQARQSVSPLKLTVIHPAVTPSAPGGVSPRLLVAAGIVGGLLLSLVVLLVRRRLSHRVRDAAGLAAVAGAPPLVVLPWERACAHTAQGVLSGAEGPWAEGVRRLRGELRAARVSTDAPVRIAVASVERGAGASLLATGLAVSYARAGYSVLLVDVSMNPAAAGSRTLSTLLDLEEHVGITGFLTGKASLADQVVELRGLLHVLPGGAARRGGAQLHLTRDLETLLQEVGKEYDVVVHDAGSVLAAADVSQALALADLAVLVTAADRATADGVGQALLETRRAGADVVGVVLNRY